MYTLYVLLVFMSPKFHSVLLYHQPCSRYKAAKNRTEYTEWPQNDLEYLTFKSTLYMR